MFETLVLGGIEVEVKYSEEMYFIFSMEDASMRSFQARNFRLGAPTKILRSILETDFIVSTKVLSSHLYGINTMAVPRS